MELVDGPTLADLIAQEPIRLEEALPIAKQIAEALEAAHDQGIVHRDLEPANIKVRADSTVKVLDFGLAKAMEQARGSGPSIAGSPSISPTLMSPVQMTGVGVILGTAAYMAPEQAAGKAADRRADIWAFGVVLWEMLTGRQLFAAETIAHTLAEVLRAPIDVGQLPAATPGAVRDLVSRCLTRDVRARLRDIGEARIVIQNALDHPVEPPRRRLTVPELAARRERCG
jgi:eukaryotic-like serine/threonine-protein kinase